MLLATSIARRGQRTDGLPHGSLQCVCTAHAIEPLITLTSLSHRCFDSSVPLLCRRSDPDETASAQACNRKSPNNYGPE